MIDEEENKVDRNEYMFAACESLMMDYCNFLTTSRMNDNECRETFFNPTATTTTTATSTGTTDDLRDVASKMIQTNNDSNDINSQNDSDVLMNFFRTLHQQSDRWYTERQRALNLPFPLMMAATISNMAMMDGRVSQLRQQQQRNVLFHRLQQIVMEQRIVNDSSHPRRHKLPNKNRNQNRYYAWSPTLQIVTLSQSPQQTTPTKQEKSLDDCDVMMVNALLLHINHRRDHLMQQAIAAQQQLLYMMEPTTTTDTKRHTGTAKTKLSRVGHHRIGPPILEQTDTVDAADSDSDEEDVIVDVAADGSNNVDTIITCNDIDIHDVAHDDERSPQHDDDWNQVQIRRKVPVNATSVDMIGSIVVSPNPTAQHVLQEQSTNHARVEDTARTYIDVTSRSDIPNPMDVHAQGEDVMTCDHGTAKSNFGRNGTTADGGAVVSNTTTQALNNNSNTFTAVSVHTDAVDNRDGVQQLQVPMLMEKISNLKLRLQQMDQQRIEEQQSAQKALQHERDASYERIQALQLRLYISETRLQTYEEALQHHVEMVQQNVATPIPSTPNDPGNTMTLEDTATHALPDMNSAKIGSPLYARRTGTGLTTRNTHLSDQSTHL